MGFTGTHTAPFGKRKVSQTQELVNCVNTLFNVSGHFMKIDENCTESVISFFFLFHLFERYACWLCKIGNSSVLQIC